MTSANPPQSEPDTSPTGIQKTLGWLATVFAPLTVVTALLYYVGWERTRSFLRYFGVDGGQAGYSVQDYLLGSGEVGFSVLATIALGGVVLFILDRLLNRQFERFSDQRVKRWSRWALVGFGAALTIIGIAGANGQVVIVPISPIMGAALLAVGPIMLVRFGSAHLGKAGGGLVIILVSLAVFWAATIYARGIGEKTAASFDFDPGQLAVVTVYSDKPLDMPGVLVRASRVMVAENDWRYRYTGAALVLYANNRWFLITNPATPDYRSSVVILHDNDSIRVETSVPIRK